jgi:hypothetical protein
MEWPLRYAAKSTSIQNSYPSFANAGSKIAHLIEPRFHGPATADFSPGNQRTKSLRLRFLRLEVKDMRSPNKQFTMLSRPDIEVDNLIRHENILTGCCMGSCGDSEMVIDYPAEKVRKAESFRLNRARWKYLISVVNKRRSNLSPNISRCGTGRRVAMSRVHLIRLGIPFSSWMRLGDSCCSSPLSENSMDFDCSGAVWDRQGNPVSAGICDRVGQSPKSVLTAAIANDRVALDYFWWLTWPDPALSRRASRGTNCPLPR